MSSAQDTAYRELNMSIASSDVQNMPIGLLGDRGAFTDGNATAKDPR